MIRWLVLLGWLGFCFFSAGISGVFWGFIGFGLVASAWYLIFDTWERVKNSLQDAVSRSNVTNQTLNLIVTPEELEALRRNRRSNPDPTRPVDEVKFVRRLTK